MPGRLRSSLIFAAVVALCLAISTADARPIAEYDPTSAESRLARQTGIQFGDLEARVRHCCKDPTLAAYYCGISQQVCDSISALDLFNDAGGISNTVPVGDGQAKGDAPAGTAADAQPTDVAVSRLVRQIGAQLGDKEARLRACCVDAASASRCGLSQRFCQDISVIFGSQRPAVVGRPGTALPGVVVLPQ